jgi:hypothetical protein
MSNFSKSDLISLKTARSNRRCFQATLISNSSQKTREAVARRIVTEDV